MSKYYKILDKDLIGRQDGVFECFIHGRDSGWLPDSENILMDRIIGYDGESVGSTDMLDRITEISEEEALKLI